MWNSCWGNRHTTELTSKLRAVTRFGISTAPPRDGLFFSPVFGCVGHSSDQLHSFGIMLRLRMQTQVPLHEVPGGHVMLPILHHAGILQSRHTNVDVDLGSPTQSQITKSSAEQKCKKWGCLFCSKVRNNRVRYHMNACYCRSFLQFSCSAVDTLQTPPGL